MLTTLLKKGKEFGMRLIKILIFSIFTSLFSSCAMLESSARVIKKQIGIGGIVATSNPYSSADLEKAKELMSENCNPKSYEITQEEEAISGQQTSMMTSAHIKTTTNITEWHFTYICK